MLELGPHPEMPDHTDNYHEMAHERTQDPRVQIGTDDSLAGKNPGKY